MPTVGKGITQVKGAALFDRPPLHFSTALYSWRTTTCRVVGSDPQERCDAVAELVDAEACRALALRLRQQHPNLTNVGRAAWFARWARRRGHLVYCDDPPGGDWWCGPESTWERGCGDCDDLAIFQLSLLHALGAKAWAVIGAARGDDGDFVGHMWVEGKDRRGFFLLEATSGSIYRYRPDNYFPAEYVYRDSCRLVK
jgi:transglutaminase-like putative cysteine protease